MVKWGLKVPLQRGTNPGRQEQLRPPPVRTWDMNGPVAGRTKVKQVTVTGVHGEPGLSDSQQIQVIGDDVVGDDISLLRQ